MVEPRFDELRAAAEDVHRYRPALRVVGGELGRLVVSADDDQGVVFVERRQIVLEHAELVPECRDVANREFGQIPVVVGSNRAESRRISRSAIEQRPVFDQRRNRHVGDVAQDQRDLGEDRLAVAGQLTLVEFVQGVLVRDLPPADLFSSVVERLCVVDLIEAEVVGLGPGLSDPRFDRHVAIAPIGQQVGE